MSFSVHFFFVALLQLGQRGGPWHRAPPPPPPCVRPCSPQCTLACVFTVQVQIFLVLLHTVTGLAVLYLPVAGTILG